MAKNVLIVDDSASVRKVTKIALSGAGYGVVEAIDGKDALGKLSEQKIHLIISDVNISNMDGISFIKEVKRLPAYKFTPIIMFTADDRESQKREGLMAGAKEWLVKPYQPSRMLMAVSKLIMP